MRALLILLLVAAVVIGVIGFDRGWFALKSDSDPHEVNIDLKIDKEKIRADTDKAKERAKEFGDETRERLKEATP